MDILQITRFRKIAGKTGALLFLLLLFFLLDGIIAQFRHPLNVLNVLPGTTMEINGQMDEKTKSFGELTYTSTSDDISLTFDAIHTGFWFGGNMWHGILTVSGQTKPGSYKISVMPKDRKVPAPFSFFKIVVFSDSASLQQSYTSLIHRTTGITPWWFAVACVPFLVLSFGIVFYLAWKEEGLMADAGKAEVYMVKKTDSDLEIKFGLGTNHGVSPGMQLDVLDDEGRRLGSITVKESWEADSTALAGAIRNMREGFVIAVRK